LFLSSASFAAEYDVEVCGLQVSNIGDAAMLQTCNLWRSQNNCGGNGWVVWDMSKFQGQAMYSTALTALATSKKVKLRLDGSSCRGSYDVTSMIRIMKNN
jgi:hypothetical protein